MTDPSRRRSARRARSRKPRGESRVGLRFEADVERVAHGGACVARHEGRAVFVRHALPGERVVVTVTEGTEGDRFWRGDAAEVLTASPDRVEAPCPVAGAGGCGGCDLQHVDLPAQRSWKTAVVREQLARLAGLDHGVAAEVEVEAVRGDVEGRRWRTRQQWAVAADGSRGLRKHRSHEVVPVVDCLIAAAQGPAPVVRGSRFEVPDGGFWQVHPGAPDVLVGAVLEALSPRPGESVLDLYAGVGLFTRFLRDAVGPDGRVVAVEGDARAAAAAARTVPDAEVVAGDVARTLEQRGSDDPDRADLVVLDPPRVGAKRAVVDQVAVRRPRAVAHVACDPAALARDVALFAERGYRLTGLRALDLFPMTHHVECVARLEPAG